MILRKAIGTKKYEVGPKGTPIISPATERRPADCQYSSLSALQQRCHLLINICCSQLLLCSLHTAMTKLDVPSAAVVTGATSAADSSASKKLEAKEIKLWGGRFQESVTDAVERFTESISYDKDLYKHDISGSRAHASMLAKQVCQFLLSFCDFCEALFCFVSGKECLMCICGVRGTLMGPNDDDELWIMLKFDLLRRPGNFQLPCAFMIVIRGFDCRD